MEAAYEQAKAASDGQYSPHTAFIRLNPDDNWSAIDFLNEFGPLELFDFDADGRLRQQLALKDLIIVPRSQEGIGFDVKTRCVWVNLEEFWEKHRRFIAIAKLWEARESCENVISVLSEIQSLSVYPRIGAWRDDRRFSIGSVVPWETTSFHEWVLKANAKQVMAAAAEIIEAELELHTYVMRGRWTCPEPSRLAFRLVPQTDSLWSAMWHLFARDTTEGLGWRVCPHCSKLFYPKRKDSYFCEPKYQKLHATNNWWKEHKEVELAHRRDARARGRFGQATTKRKQRVRKA